MAGSLLWNDLAREIIDGQVVVLVGAGLSIAASQGMRAASWTGLLTTGVERCEQLATALPTGWSARVRGEIASGDLDDLLSAAQKVTRKLDRQGGGEYRRWLRETVGELKLRDPAVLQALAALGLPLVTTNYDSLLEEATGMEPVTWRDPPRAQRVLRGDESGIVHLHGHWREPESVVLGIGSYEELLGDAPAQALLQALATFRSFLLVGFGRGLEDPNFAVLRSWMAAAHGGSEYRHYRLVLDHETEAAVAEHDPRERVTAVGYGARHEDLAGFLGGLSGSAPHERAAQRMGARRGAGERGAERRYREVALRAFDIIDLGNLPENDRYLATQNLQLRRLYVPLHVEIELAAGSALGQAQLLALEQRRTGRILEAWRDPLPPRWDDRLRVPFGQRLSAARRLVVLGDPGAGKTTLLRWLATAYLLRLQQDADLAELPDADTVPDLNWLPALIRCRDLGSEATGSVGNALRCSLHKLELAPEECEAVLTMLRRSLVAGSALVLIDGLDEICDPTLRVRFCQQLEQFHVAYPDTPMVVTSRIVGYRELGTRIGRGFEHVTLSELTREEKDDFAKRWCALTELPERRAEVEAGLISDLHATQRIEDLTGNPMLLTTMALVRRRIGKLPSRRVSLYEEAIKTLLNWRREVDEPLDEDEALPQLRYLAYVMCDRGVQQLRADEAIELLSQMRKEYPQLRRVARRDPEDLLRLLERRTGILAETGEVRHDGELVPVYEFRHLTFQEYLAGLALVCGHFPGADQSRSLAERIAPLAARITTPGAGEAAVVASWREPLRLCLAACNDADTDDALLAILGPAAGEDPTVTRARAVQAARCLADEPNVTESVADKVLRAFVRHIDVIDGGGEEEETSIQTAARELAGSDLWVRPLERHLCAEFRHRDPVTRPNVVRVHQFTSDALGPNEDTDRIDWISLQMTQLESDDDIKAISAALHLWSAPYALSKGMEQGLEIVSVLMTALDRQGPVAHAAALALRQLAFLPYTFGWLPTTHNLHQFNALLSDADRDPGVLASIITILGQYRFVAAAPMLAEYLNHLNGDVRRQAAVALGQLGDCRAAEALLTLLTCSDMALWSAAAKAADLLGEYRALEPLLDQLHNSEAKTRRTAVEALGELHDERAFEPLLESLSDVDASVRAQAAKALGELGDVRAFEPLLEQLNHTDTRVRRETSEALGWLRDVRAFEPLLERLNDTDAWLRGRVAMDLGWLGDVRAFEPLLERLNDTEEGVWWGASWGLGLLGDVRAVEPLLALVTTHDAAAPRGNAAWALGQLGDARAVEPLLGLLSDSDGYTRLRVVQALGELGDAQAVEPLLGLLSDTDPNMRQEAARALGELGDAQAVEPLLDRLGDRVPEVRSAAVQAVNRLGVGGKTEELLKRLTHPDSLSRSAVAEVLGRLGDQRATEPLLIRLDDTDLDVRVATIKALGRLGDRRVVESLLQRLDDDEVDMRQAAAEALGRLRDERAAKPLLAKLDDINVNVRAAAAEALGEIRDDRAVAPLIDCARHGGRPLRSAAVIALGHIGDPDGLAELRQLLSATVRHMRIAALKGLSYTCDDETDRKLLTRVPDCRFPIGGPHVFRVARALDLSQEEIRCRYENLAERFPLRLAWKES